MTTIHKKNQNKFNLLVGTYTNTDSCASSGIYIYEFDAVLGDLKLKNSSEKVINPSYLSVSADNKFLYSVNENGNESTISVFRYRSFSGNLTFLNKSDTIGTDPCYLINDDKNVIVANYGSGSIAVFKKMPDGRISKIQQLIQHEGRGINESRQESAHVHMVLFSPDKKFVLSNDLGTDKIYIYAYEPDSEKEILKSRKIIDVPSGSGPRHSVFSDKGQFLYVIHELDETLTTYSYDINGSLKLLNQTNITPENMEKAASAAAIKISPDGKFLYVTDRGDANLISIYKILENGNPEIIGHVSTLGNNPRDFAIDPSGNYLLVGNQDSGNITIFKRDIATGELIYTGKTIENCSPAYLEFFEL